jgi:glycosyltransferase involved in cell wall biosynthesis
MFGSVTKTMIPPLLEATDIAFIGAKKQPLYEHGISPNKLVDYMMSGRPIVSAIAAGNDPVSDAQCGLTVEPGNSAALAAAITSLVALSDEKLRALGELGQTYVRENYMYDVLAARFLEVLTNLQHEVVSDQ